MPIKDAFEIFMKIFHRDGTQFMKEASDLDPRVGVGIPTILGRHEEPICLVTVLVQSRGVVMTIPKHEADFGGHFAQQSRGRLTVSDIGGSQQSSDREPDRGNDGDHMQFPSIDPAVPARFGPVGFGINRGMGDFPLLAMLLMPEASTGAQLYYRWLPPAHS
jgi:hypothetical protein